MSRITRTPAARKDMTGISKHIAAQNKSAAAHWLDLIEDKLNLLASHPELGESRPELGVGLRVFSVGNYAIIFKRKRDGIRVARIVDARRDYAALFHEGS